MMLPAANASAVAGREAVYFADPNLKAAIEKRLCINDPNHDDMLRLTDLRAENRGIRDLTGLEHADNLKILQLEGNQIGDISVLTGLIHLEFVDLADNCIRDLPRLTELKKLEWLILYNNGFGDFPAAREQIGLENAAIVFYEGNRDPDLTAPPLETAIVRPDNDYVFDGPCECKGSKRAKLPAPVREKICEITLKAFQGRFFEGIRPQKYSGLFGPVFRIRIPGRERLLLYVYIINGIGTGSDTMCLIVHDSRTDRVSPKPANFSGRWMYGRWAEVPISKPYVDFNDINLDGNCEIVFKERIHNGTALNAVVHHFLHINSDLRLVPILRLEKYGQNNWSSVKNGEDRYVVRSIEKIGPGKINIRISLSADPFERGEREVGWAVLESAGASSAFRLREGFVYVDEGLSERAVDYYEDVLLVSCSSPYR
jgi:hypothetical protein